MRRSNTFPLTSGSAGLVVLTSAALWSGAVGAAEVRGVIEFPPIQTAQSSMSYTRTRVARPAKAYASPKADVALMLAVKDSLPTPPPNKTWKIEVRGLRLEPPVVACAVDEQVEITNLDAGSLTLSIGDESLGKLARGQSVTHKCQRAGGHRIRSEEWPHLKGYVHIGALGMTTLPQAGGGFSFRAPKGTYNFQVVGINGVLFSREVKVEGGDVDLGQIDVKDPNSGAPVVEEKTDAPSGNLFPVNPNAAPAAPNGAGEP